jgi:hypothetical protein
MTHQTLYPLVIGVLDIGLAGLLLVIAPLLGVIMGIVGFVVLGTYLAQQSPLRETEDLNSAVPVGDSLPEK